MNNVSGLVTKNELSESLRKAIEEGAIVKSPTPPIDAEEGALWLDESDDAFQGTVLEGIQDDLANKISVGEKGQPNGVAALGMDGLISPEQLAGLSLTTETGNYLGNGIDGRVISVPFTPSLVIVFATDRDTLGILTKIASMEIYLNGTNTDTQYRSDSIVENGFQVHRSGNYALNLSNHVFTWVAFK